MRIASFTISSSVFSGSGGTFTVTGAGSSPEGCSTGVTSAVAGAGAGSGVAVVAAVAGTGAGAASGAGVAAVVVLGRPSE